MYQKSSSKAECGCVCGSSKIKSVFLGYRPVINLKKLNQNIPYIYFKMKGLFLLQELLKNVDFLCSLDLKDAYFSVTLHKICQNLPEISQITMAGKSLRVSLPVLWPGTCSKNIHKNNENSDCLVRRLNVWLIICLDNILLMGSTIEEIRVSRILIFVFQNLGFVINFQKSVLNHSHQIQFLGVEIDSLSMKVSLLLLKKK